MGLYISRKLMVMCAVFLMAATQFMQGANTSITASIDSAYIIMGKQTTLHLEVLDDSKTGVILLNNDADTLVKEVEIIKMFPTDTSDLGNSRYQIRQDIVIQSFDSGLYTLPPIRYVKGNDTFASNTLILKVLPVPVDTLQTIHGYADVVSPSFHFFDFIPDFISDNWGWILLGLILIAAIIVAYCVMTKRVKIQITPPKKPVPPYQLAMESLNRLKEEKLCEKGQEKEYYTQLTGILRIYLEQRFGINAMEMTSSQIITSLYANEETKRPISYMRQVLEIADFVKFAKVRPLPDDNVKSFNSAVEFVEATKPVVQTDENKELSNDKQ